MEHYALISESVFFGHSGLQTQVFKAALQLAEAVNVYAFAQQFNVIFGQQVGVYVVHRNGLVNAVLKHGNLSAKVCYGVPCRLLLFGGLIVIFWYKSVYAYHY